VRERGEDFCQSAANQYAADRKQRDSRKQPYSPPYALTVRSSAALLSAETLIVPDDCFTASETALIATEFRRTATFGLATAGRTKLAALAGRHTTALLPSIIATG